MSSRSPASGFSQNVGLPAAIEARISSAWADVAAAMTVASAVAIVSAMDGGGRGPGLGRDLGGAGRVGIRDEDLVDARRVAQ